MQLGMVGLGKMGANMTTRLIRGGHEIVVYDRDAKAVATAVAGHAAGASSIEQLVSQLRAPRAVWVMVPSGDPTESTIQALGALLSRGDTVIDGGNSNYKDGMRRSAALAARGVQFIDAGTSGGVWGLAEGYSLMIGGDEAVVRRLDPIFKALAPGRGEGAPTPNREGRDPRVEEGYLHAGPCGAGHFVKMIHNGIEYGLMQAYAEGVSILRHKTEFALDLPEIAEVWRHGSVVRSWLLDLTANALRDNPALDGIAPYVVDSGEGRWTVAEAIDLDVPAPIITQSLIERLRSRDADSYTDKLLAALRNQFGGHAIKSEPVPAAGSRAS